jgi:protochlorophyllide reductase
VRSHFLCSTVSSGIGLSAAKLLVMNNPSHRIILACRTQESADRARKDLWTLLPNDEHSRRNIIALACDHTSFECIRQFNESSRTQLDTSYNPIKWAHNGIDVLCLNAAILVPKDSGPQFTSDELEVTFQTNFLAPFLLLHLIMDRVNPGARIVLTTSGLYQHVSLTNFNGMVDARTRHARKNFDTIDGSTYHYKTCYSMSKLCLVVLCAELRRRIPNDRGVTVNCFSPGLMTTSGLFRNQSTNDFRRDALLKEKTVEWGAGALVYMAIGSETGKRNCEYWSDTDSTLGWESQYGQHFCPINIESLVALEIRKELWRLSCELVGIPNDDSTNV